METKNPRDKPGFMEKIVDRLEGVGDDEPHFVVIRYILWFIWAIWELLFLGCRKVIELFQLKQKEE